MDDKPRDLVAEAFAKLGWPMPDLADYLRTDHGEGNIVLCHKTSQAPQTSFREKGNVIILGPDIKGEITIEARRGGVVGLAGRTDIRKLLAMELISRGNLIAIGTDCDIGSMDITAGEYRQTVRIGNDCLIASGVVVRTTDGHSIFDRTSGKRLNLSGPVVIEDHVWLTQQVRILKGARIGTGSVIGHGSFISGVTVEPHCVYAGVPARKLRDNIVWDRRSSLQELPPDLRVPAS
jgi:acetyltransferase-like isoleucine patch superfamily enzyme